MRDVIVVGDANVDIIVPYPRFLDEERTHVQYFVPSIQGGGTSANTAVGLARLGVATSFIGTVGEDQYGRFVCENFESEGVDISGLIVDPHLNTVGVFAFVDERGERYLWGWPREDRSFQILDPDRISYERIRNADWIHSSGMCLAYDTSARSTIIRVFEEAHAAGVPTSFDLNLRVDDGMLDPGFAQALERILPSVTHLLGSGPDEFAYLGNGDWRCNARALSGNSRVVVARNGCRGSTCFIRGRTIESPAFRINVVDTIGAGDAYNAGYIRALLEGADMECALCQGNATSAYTVERKGARSQPTAEQLEEFLDSHDTHLARDV